MSLAAYATWLAVVFGPASLWLQGRLESSWQTSVGFIGQATVLLLFVLRARLHDRPGGNATLSRLAVLLQAPAALAACAAFNDGLQPALLVLVVSQIALGFPWPVALGFIVVTDLALAAVLLVQGPFNDPAISDHHVPHHATLLAAYLGFQAFAMLTCSYARRAEEARDEAVRVNAELMATRQLLSEGARSEERLRLSRELHDVAGHKLTALKLQLTLAERRGDSSKAVLADGRDLADDLLTDIRGIVGSLRDHEGIDLRQALHTLTQALPFPLIALEIDPAIRVAGIERAQTLLRCAQEGLTNILRHSGATRATVRLTLEDGLLLLTIEDNGCGLKDAAPGNGLTGLRERLTALDGTLELAAAAGGGTRLTAALAS
ncbi:MAG: histidine kinase [Sinimarinibacterium sp.]|jgi:signal transduction histidine kinase